MEALTGTSTSRKRRQDSEVEADEGSSSSKKGAVVSPPVKEIIPAIFKAGLTLPSHRGRKIDSEQLLTPEELEEFRNLPCDTEVALLNLRESFPLGIFEGRLPPVMMYSQLASLVHSRSVIDHQLKRLAGENKILTFSLFSGSNYLIVFFSDFVKLRRKGLFQRFVDEVLGEEAVQASGPGGSNGGGTGEAIARMISASSLANAGVKRSPENSKLISKESLLKKWKFEEDEVRQLVNAGYLGVQEGGYYCVSLPAAGDFIKMYERGKKAVINGIRRAKFGEILQKDFEQRPMKKTAPLGVPYHIYDLLGSGDITKVDTTSGPLLRIKRDREPPT